MGLFSSSHKTYVSSSMQPLFEDAPVTNANDLIIKTVLQNKSITDAYIKHMLDGIRNNVKRYVKYAEDYYTLGLPQGSVGKYAEVSDVVIKEILDDLLEEPVTIIESIIAPLTYTHVVTDYLYTERGLDLQTNEVTVYNPAWIIEQGETGASPIYVYNTQLLTDGITLRITYHYTYQIEENTLNGMEFITYTNTVTDDVLTADLTDDIVEIDAKYIITRFIIDSTQEISWWLYRLDSGTYPALAAEYEEQVEEDFFLPIVPIRYNNEDLTSGSYRDEDLYKTSKRLLQKVKLSIDDIASALAENPHIDDIDHVFLVSALNLVTEHVPSIYYLGTYFHHLYERQLVNQSTYTDAGANVYAFLDTATLALGTTNISFLEHGLDLAISFDYISSHFRNGVIGEVGFAYSKTVIQENPDWDPLYGSVGRDIYGITYYYQIDKLHYREVYVRNPTSINNIYRDTLAITTLPTALASPDEYQLYVPLHYGLWNQLPKGMQETVFQNSFALILNSYERVSVAWYESGFFKALIIVVVGIIIAWTQQYWLMALLKAAQAGLVALAMFVLETIIVGFVVKGISDFIIEEFGEKLGFITIVALIVAAAFMRNPAIFSLMGRTMQVTAMNLLSFSSVMLQSITTQLQQDMYDIQNTITAFASETEEKWEKLEEKIKSLFPEAKFDILDVLYQTTPITTKATIESPAAFYYRTVYGVPNVGTQAFDILHNYYDINLSFQMPSY